MRLRLRRGTTAQAAFGIGDQALSSVTNFALSILVARNVSAGEFGAFTLAFATYLIFLTISRSLTTEPLTIRYSTATTDDWRRGVAAATGSAVVLGVAAGAVIAVVGLVMGGSVGSVLVVVGLTLPGLLLQDAWRFAFFAAKRGGSALANDLVWAVVLFAVLVVAAQLTTLTATTSVLIWSGGAAVAAAFGVAQSRVLPRPGLALHWWREHWDLVPRLTTEAIVLSGAQPLTLFVVGGVAGLAATGAVRAGQVLMNALHVLSHGLQLSAVPEATRLGARSTRSLLRFCLLISGGIAVVAAGWTTVLLLLPDQWGEALLGDTWSDARTVVLPLGVVAMTRGFQAGGLIGLRARAATRRSLWARSVSSALLLVGGVGGALIDSATGAAWGMAVAAVIGTIGWWYHLLNDLAEPGAHAPAPMAPT
jgi:O-antigen/teichoic acid export membrane protein